MAFIKKTMKAVLKKPASSMKAMKRMRASKIARGRGAKSKVLSGKKQKTVGGLTANDLFRNKRGKVVSKKLSAASKDHPWMKALAEARKSLGLTGFVTINKGQDGQALYA